MRNNGAHYIVKNTVPSDGGYGVYKVYSDCVYFMVKFGFNDLTALSRRTGAVRILNRKEASPF
ncbi:hypothetical protein EEE23_00445 [Neisseria gonorrhoeae]|uniref:Uncharacterized protein n=2 Tax=Neisseria gonorrhoeae TaxID=485 RepID=Q5F9J7_NEIG1|nr:hypothetical protein NGO_0396 [Neisseria gonorrhoeae FA 1090]AVH82973.1 hypothetical protein A6J46_10585 [Neisseria gonorrhoeae]EEZ56626.1 conserved hypothetical protein [Neisseria gonorrhoeae SK-92-679]PAX25096.1 hypothetical protein CKX34_00825 [Neisseria gonorrhoeae]QGG73668.1 hypothetical protein GIJ09_02485 [Neisseria gonorrhoeae]